MFCSHNHYCHRHHLSTFTKCRFMFEWSKALVERKTEKTATEKKCCCPPKFARFVARFLFSCTLWHIHFANLLYRSENVYIMLSLICIHLCRRWFLCGIETEKCWVLHTLYAFNNNTHSPSSLFWHHRFCRRPFFLLWIRFHLFISASIFIPLAAPLFISKANWNVKRKKMHSYRIT